MLWNVRSKTAKFWHLCTDDFPVFPSALDRTYLNPSPSAILIAHVHVGGLVQVDGYDG